MATILDIRKGRFYQFWISEYDLNDKMDTVPSDTPQRLYNTIAGIQSKNMLAKQWCCIQIKMYGLYSHFFYIIYTFSFEYNTFGIYL